MKSKLNDEVFRMYGDNPEVRSWLARLNRRARRDRRVHKALEDDSCFKGDSLHIFKR